jgi:hypothetical protein
VQLRVAESMYALTLTAIARSVQQPLPLNNKVYLLHP